MPFLGVASLNTKPEGGDRCSAQKTIDIPENKNYKLGPLAIININGVMGKSGYNPTNIEVVSLHL